VASRREWVARFAVGSPNGPSSAIWLIWAKARDHERPAQSDVYLSTRPLAGSLKVSLHESGEWQYSFTSQWMQQSASTATSLTSRHVDRWQRPQEFAPGFTLAFQIVFPLWALGPSSQTCTKPVHWISAVGGADIVEVAVLLSRADVRVREGEWPGRRSMNTRLVTRTIVQSGETVWVLALPTTASDEFNKTCVSLRSGFQELVKSRLPGRRNLRAVVLATGANGARLLVDLALEPADGSIDPGPS
jgi:hypothetical protein